MIALIDGDIVAYSCAAFNEEFGWAQCQQDIDDMIDRILQTTESDSMQIYVSGPDNFRYGIYPEYKANRKGKPDPIYRQQANGYLVERYGARVTIGHEADDALGTMASGEIGNCVVCSIDKDLKQIPGRHYNWRKDEFDVVSPVDGLRSFYRNLLIGDTADNIRGVAGIGVVKAGRIINDLEDEEDMFRAVQALYRDDARFLMNGQLMWLWRYDNNIWEFPFESTFESEGETLPVQE
jgi:DNA polymerase-1